MNFQRKKVATALAYTLGVSGALTLSAAYAQTSSPDIRVEVTGSNIKRVEGEGALPVTVITREEINRTGAQTAYDMLQLISSNTSGGNVSFGNVIGATTFSAQTASLRGLGGQATLILINGKRVSSFSGEVQGVYGVNLDVIPFSAIERIEVLKDGASAVYGSDAIGGVINFILRQDYRGYEATAFAGVPTRGGGGGEIYNIKGTAGWGDLGKDRWNAFISASYNEQRPLEQRARSFSNTSYIPSEGVNATSGNTFPGFISTGGIGNPGFPNCEPSTAIGTRCRYDPNRQPGVESIPETKTTNVFGSGRFQINNDWQAYLWGFYTREENRFIIQPTPLSDAIFYGPNGDIPATITVSPTSPYYPTAAAAAAGVAGETLNVRYRCVVCGNRDTTDTNEGWQGVAGVKGTIGNWDTDFDFFYSQNKNKEHLNGGFVKYSEALPLLSGGTINLFGPTPDAALQAFQQTAFTQDTFHGESKNYGVQGKASAEIYKMPAGPLGFAVGFEARKETLEQSSNPALAEGDVSGYGGNFLPISADRRDESLFAEFNIPIVKTVEVNAAVRYDHYSDFGNTTNPKLSVRWQPVQQLLLRGSWGTGFIAPTLTQLFGQQTSGLTQAGISDPVRCPVTQGTAIGQLDCDTQFTLLFGGNPALAPEKANQWQVGFVLEPSQYFSIGIDYFNIDLKNLFVNGIDYNTVLADQAQFGSLITRAAPDPQFPNLPGRIVRIDQTFINLGDVKIAGFDVDARLRFPATAWGRVTASLNGTYFQKYDVEQQDGSFAGFVANGFGGVTPGINPRWKHYASVNWQYGPWSTTLANNFQTGYIDFNTDVNDNLRRVSSMSLWDIQTAYTGFKNWTLTAGVRNLFDTNPPFTNQTTTFQTGYDPSYYDPRARFVYASVGFAFK
ncbi:MAG TPA: TonB-dependent receptor [Casimicrobiaceae bacterium]|nr:TonB-dependent receptor [Casimicrobiaceae bacterium]